MPSSRLEKILSLMVFWTLAVVWSPAWVYAEGQVYESEEFRYSVELPEGWTVMTRAELPPESLTMLREGMLSAIPAGGKHAKFAQKMRIDALFIGHGEKSAGGSNALAFGFDLAELDVPPEKVSDFFIGAVETTEQAMPTRRVDFHRAFPQVELGEAVIDTSSLQYVVRQKVPDEGGMLDVYLWAKVGKTKMVMFVLANPMGYDAGVAKTTFDQTFRLHPDEVNAEAQLSREYYDLGRRVGKNLCWLVAVAMVVGVGVFLWRRRRAQQFEAWD